MDQMSPFCPNQSATGSGQMFTSLIQLLIAAQCNISRPDMWPEDATHKLLPEYDFIVVGAGSAGCAVASRLSEISHWKVLLIEAGGDPPVMSEVPGLATTLYDSEYDWKYYTEPGPTHSLSLVDGRQYWSRGKLLGGCSAHNGMIYLRGIQRDYDGWERLGNYGWGYDSVLDYFKKSEDLRIPSLWESDRGRFHGVGGELKVSNFVYSFPMDYYMQATKELGYEFIKDINGYQNIGFAVYPATVDGATRCSSAKAFLTKRKQNLHVIKNAHVTRILIDQFSKETRGVEFVSSLRGKLQVKASKEVIVSGGAVNTPQLLLLSGIGPAEQLRKHGIHVLSNRPVGKNLQDHIDLPFFISLKDDDSTRSSHGDNFDNMYTYLRHKTGPLAINDLWNVLGLINTNNSFSKFPNVQLVNSLFYKQQSDVLNAFLQSIRYPNEYIRSITNVNERSDILMIMLFMMNPKSRGEIMLRSANPFDKPLIYPNYLQEAEDVEVLVEGARFINKFLRTNAMKQQGAQLVGRGISNCDKFTFNSDEYWRCTARNRAITGMHMAGTAKMGPHDDPTAVVDPELRVYGVKGLRVADTSIMPTVTTGDTNAPAILIGEKAAAMIIKDWLPIKNH